LIRRFAESVFAEDRMAVETEQRAYDLQRGDWNQEVNPVIIALRDLLGRSGVPLGGSATATPSLTQRARLAERGSTYPSAARSIAAMSSRFMLSIACMARCALPASGSVIRASSCLGTICQDSPNRSFTQPHCSASGTAESASVRRSTSR